MKDFRVKVYNQSEIEENEKQECRYAQLTTIMLFVLCLLVMIGVITDDNKSESTNTPDATEIQDRSFSVTSKSDSDYNIDSSC
jgi:hypothetical protein